MQKNGKFLRLSPIVAVALMAVMISLSSGLTSSVTAATSEATSAAATMEGTVDVSAFAECMAPTPTPSVPTPEATMAATSAATMAATMAATESATMAATSAATIAATKPAAQPTATHKPTATKIPPTATKIPVGKKPANAGITLNVNAKMVRADGSRCVNVVSVTKGGPADIAGIQAHDFILGFNQTEIKAAADFYDQVSNYSSGDKVYVTVQRSTDVMTVEVELGLNPFVK